MHRVSGKTVGLDVEMGQNLSDNRRLPEVLMTRGPL